MKRFKYRLERVLEFRESERKDRELSLSAKNFELHSAESRLGDIIELQDRATLPEDGELSMAELTLQREFQMGLREMLERQRILIQEATEAVEAARNAYLEKAVEAEALLTHKSKKKEEHLAERRQAERRSQDELTIQRFKRVK
jgi:flagellar export protein FliJ